MLKIRLSRTGKKIQSNFRVVLQEHTSPAKGKFIEKLGYYRPETANKEFKVDEERVKYWLSVGARPSDTVAVLLKANGFSDMDKYIAPRNAQKKKKKEDASAEAPAETPAEEKTEAPAEKPEEAPAEAPAEEKTEAPAEKPEEAPAETPAEEKTEAPAEKPAEAPAEEPKK